MRKFRSFAAAFVRSGVFKFLLGAAIAYGATKLDVPPEVAQGAKQLAPVAADAAADAIQP